MGLALAAKSDSTARLRAKTRHCARAFHVSGRLSAVEVAKRLAIEQLPAMSGRGLSADDGAIGFALPLVIGRGAGCGQRRQKQDGQGKQDTHGRHSKGRWRHCNRIAGRRKLN